MAPLRSSRHTRNAEHNAPARNRAGVVDYDPTDGLPVRKYVLETVKVNQDTAADSTDPETKSQANKEESTYYPWDDLPLPSFFDQLPAHNQELIRRARQGNRDIKHSVWDRKTEEWVKYEKAKVMGLVGNVMKSRHLMNADADNGENDDDEGGEEDEDEEMPDGVVAGTAVKKRKVVTAGNLDEDRTFEVRRWVAVPADKADKMTDPKYLADRRPGMPSLYTNAAVLKQASGYGAPVTAVNEYSGFDLGDGSGLGNAIGGAAGAPGEVTPVRKHNMPPRRKKKKLGGPGRRKAVPVEAAEKTALPEMKEGGIAENPGAEEEKKEGDVDDNGEEGSGDDSEGEGSEEGEVNEEPPATDTVPQVTVDVATDEVAITADVPAITTPPAVPVIEEKPIDIVMEEAAPAPSTLPEKKEADIDLLGGLEAALDKGE